MLSAYYFDVLVKGSQEVHIFFVENGQKERSRFVEKLLWERQREEGSDSSDVYVAHLGYHVSLEDVPPATIPKTAEVCTFLRSMTFDATGLDTYLRCPVQFYYRRILCLSKKDEGWADVQRVDVGRLVHQIMLAYYDRRKGIPLKPADLDPAEMRFLVDSVFKEYCGSEVAGRFYLLKQQIMRQMEAYLQHYEVPLVTRLPVTVLHLEHRLSCVVQGFRLIGVLDRVDTRDGTTWIVDYKTSGAQERFAINFNRLDLTDRSSWGQAIGSLQLAFYCLLWDEARGMETDDREALFLLLGKAYLDQKIEVRLFEKDDERRSSYQKMRSVILCLMKEIVNPEIPFDPAMRKKNSCSFCDYQSLCGTQ
jgi:CRISPR/Cas system-associated exonuclease Cas4 (RecB family)